MKEDIQMPAYTCKDTKLRVVIREIRTETIRRDLYTNI